MKRKRHLEIGNFVCRFGDENLLDRLDEVVLPAFEAGLVRQFGRTRYFFHEVQILDVGSKKKPSPAIVGRLVKQSVLVSEQDYVNGELRQRHEELSDAPSSFFTLILATHRLLFVREHARAPEMGVFGTTAEHFMKQVRARLLKAKYDTLKSAGDKVTHKALAESLPPPEITVNPVLLDSKITDFVSRFDSIKKVSIRLSPVNAEIDMNEFFEDLRDQSESMNAKSAGITYNAKRDDGLNTSETEKQIRAAKEGHAKFKVEGIDPHGNRISGDNEEAKVRVPLEDEAETDEERAAEATQRFEELTEDGLISAGPTEGFAHAQLKGLVSKLLGS